MIYFIQNKSKNDEVVYVGLTVLKKNYRKKNEWV